MCNVKCRYWQIFAPSIDLLSQLISACRLMYRHLRPVVTNSNNGSSIRNLRFGSVRISRQITYAINRILTEQYHRNLAFDYQKKKFFFLFTSSINRTETVFTKIWNATGTNKNIVLQSKSWKPTNQKILCSCEKSTREKL